MGGEWKEFEKRGAVYRAERSRVSECLEKAVTWRRCPEPRPAGADLIGHSEDGAGLPPTLQELEEFLGTKEGAELEIWEPLDWLLAESPSEAWLCSPLRARALLWRHRGAGHRGEHVC